MGTYLYNIKLKSDSAELTDIIYIKAELGESNTRIILFENQFDQLLEFSIKVKYESNEFIYINNYFNGCYNYL